MAVIKWGDVQAAEGVLTTELNALADGANKITTSALSNDAAAELDVYADFTLYVGVQTARDAGAYVSLYILPEVNSVFPYGGDSLDPAGNLCVGAFQLDAAVTARQAHIRGIILPPDDFHVLVINETGQAFAATLNTLYMRRYNMESA